MTGNSLLTRTAVTIAALFAIGLASAPAPALSPDDPDGSWSRTIWESVLDGDYAAVGQELERLPQEAKSNEQVSRFRETYDQYRANRSIADNDRVAARDEAIEELQVLLDEGSLSESLRAAVAVQELSGNFNEALEDPQIKQIVARAEAEIPEVEQRSDWLTAQELLYRLRTLYDETDQFDRYQTFDDHLDAVNRRVSLLARYAPRRLHDLRVDRAERLGDEPLGEFNPSNAIDWRERMDDIDHLMLKSALRIAAEEHIESDGWRPLLVGGLDALILFASTPALSETFPELGNAGKVNRWIGHLEDELERIAKTPDGLLKSRTLSNVLDGVMWINERTLDLPSEVVYREFGDGAMERLDRFSEIIWPDKLRRFEQSTQGNFVGVGILIRHNDKREIEVVNPLEGTPAYFAGVKPNDLILEVAGESTVGWSLNDAVDRITGKRGTPVTIGVRREGVEETVPITITRDVIKIRSVKGWWKDRLNENGDPIWNWYVDPVTRVAYIKLTQFTEDTRNDLLRAWAEIMADGRPNGLILDLRYNPGGLLSSAVEISNLFLRDGVIVSGEDKTGRKAWPDQKADPRFAKLADVPIVVLVNRGSASASEIVAGCLQAHGAAMVLGDRSFGKGSVQTVHHIAREARLKLTTQYYRLPPGPGEEKGRLVHKRPGAKEWGVDPNIAVTMTPAQVIASIELRQAADIIPLDEDGKLDPDSSERPDVSGLIADGLDPQLEVALLLLQAGALSQVEADVLHAMNAEEEPAAAMP